MTEFFSRRKEKMEKLSRRSYLWDFASGPLGSHKQNSANESPRHLAPCSQIATLWRRTPTSVLTVLLLEMYMPLETVQRCKIMSQTIWSHSFARLLGRRGRIRRPCKSPSANGERLPRRSERGFLKLQIT